MRRNDGYEFRYDAVSARHPRMRRAFVRPPGYAMFGALRWADGTDLDLLDTLVAAGADVGEAVDRAVFGVFVSPTCTVCHTPHLLLSIDGGLRRGHPGAAAPAPVAALSDLWRRTLCAAHRGLRCLTGQPPGAAVADSDLPSARPGRRGPHRPVRPGAGDPRDRDRAVGAAAIGGADVRRHGADGPGPGAPGDPPRGHPDRLDQRDHQRRFVDRSGRRRAASPQPGRRARVHPRRQPRALDPRPAGWGRSPVDVPARPAR